MVSGDFGFFLDVFEFDAEVSFDVDVIDDRFAGFFDCRGGFDEGPLAEQVFGECAAAGGGVVHGVEFFVAIAVVDMRLGGTEPLLVENSSFSK